MSMISVVLFDVLVSCGKVGVGRWGNTWFFLFFSFLFFTLRYSSMSCLYSLFKAFNCIDCLFLLFSITHHIVDFLTNIPKRLKISLFHVPFPKITFNQTTKNTSTYNYFNKLCKAQDLYSNTCYYRGYAEYFLSCDHSDWHKPFLYAYTWKWFSYTNASLYIIQQNYQIMKSEHRINKKKSPQLKCRPSPANRVRRSKEIHPVIKSCKASIFQNNRRQERKDIRHYNRVLAAAKGTWRGWGRARKERKEAVICCDLVCRREAHAACKET